MSSPSLSDIFYSNYSICGANQNVLATWQGLANVSHTIQLFGIPVEILTAFLIIKKSPKVMKSIRKPLLISHFWCSFCDFSIGVLATPFYFIPTLAGFHVGVFSYFRVPIALQLVFMVQVMLAMVIAIIYLFESRSSSIQENRFRITRRSSRVFYYTLIYLSNSLLTLVLLKSPEDQESARREALKSIPCPTEEFFSVPAFVILSDPFWINVVNFYLIPAIYLNAIIQIFFHSTSCVYYLYISPTITTSPNTRLLQKQFFVASVIQASVPFLVLIVPFVAGTLALLIGKFDQAFMNFLLIVIATHGIAESLTIILINKAYRNWLVGVFQGSKVDAGTPELNVIN